MTVTPAMQQYYELRDQNKDCILFFRMGDFYEMFEKDAEIAHKVLGISITSRNKNAEVPIALAGIPFHAKDKYLPLLVNAGYKVAIAEQVSDPKLKGIVKREVVRIVTPSTLSLEGESYANSGNNYIVSVCKEEDKYGISYIENNTNKWETGVLNNFDELTTQIYKIAPSEVILDKNLFSDNNVRDVFEKKYSLNIYYFESKPNYKQELKKHFGVKNLEGYGIENKELSIKSSALLLDYLEENQKVKLPHLEKLSYISFSGFLDLDESTIRNLDLLYNFSTNSQNIGTLFGVIDKTQTSMGKRLLKNNIVKPYADKKSILNRLQLIEELIKDPILLDKIQQELKQVSDLDNIITRLSLGRATPKDLLNLKRSLNSILNTFKIIKENNNKKIIKLLDL